MKRVGVLVVGLVLALPSAFAVAQNAPSHAAGATPPAAPLPEGKGIVSWRTLAQVQPVPLKDRVVPKFAPAVASLDRKEVKLAGFMMPLETGEKLKNFLLTAMPPTCAFCLPGGPEALVEVKMKSPITVTFDPIVLTGRLAVLKDDPAGLYYRLTDATVD